MSSAKIELDASGGFEASKTGKNYRRVAGDGASRWAGRGKSARTWKQYASSIGIFEAWCEQHKRQALPSTIETVREWIEELADAGYSCSTILVYLQAICTQHSFAGYDLDRRKLRETLRGIRRGSERPHQTRPLLGAELAGVLAMLDPGNRMDVRDGALLALGWAAALRRIEITGLDWLSRGPAPERGSGVVSPVAGGVEIVLTRSKTSQADAVRIDVPAADMPAASLWLDRWRLAAQLQPGEPVFRSFLKGGQLNAKRLSEGRVTEIIRKRVMALEIGAGTDPEQAFAKAQGFSGHSLRAGYVTTAARMKMPEWLIRQRSRHKNAETVAGYVRAAETRETNGLQGIGF